MNKFYPEPGDTIVCKNGRRFICVSRKEYEDRFGFRFDETIFAYGLRDKQNHMRWRDNSGKSYDSHDYSIKSVISSKTTTDSPKNSYDDPEFKVRVLELENKYLRALLRQAGVLF